MIDLKTVQNEVQHARHARLSAQREGFSIEEIIDLMRQSGQASAKLDLLMRSNPDELLPN